VRHAPHRPLFPSICAASKMERDFGKRRAPITTGLHAVTCTGLIELLVCAHVVVGAQARAPLSNETQLKLLKDQSSAGNILKVPACPLHGCLDNLTSLHTHIALPRSMVLPAAQWLACIRHIYNNQPVSRDAYHAS
jgi:hypothetical protein